MSEFWEQGYDRTSLSRLEEVTGVDRSTIYNSFGGKRGLHALAADCYVGLVAAALLAPLATGGADDLSDIEAFLDALADVTRSDDFPAGCFIVNDLGAPSRDRAATERYLHGLETGLRDAFVRSGSDDDVAHARSATLLAIVVGANAIATHDRNRAIGMIRAAQALVAAWRDA